MKTIILSALSLIFLSTSLQAKEVIVHMSGTNNTSPINGSVIFTDTPYGLLITPDLTNLPQGIHGFHLHQHPDCNMHGMDAGGHFDPNNTNSHQGPYANGHLGDLPVLYVSPEGLANTPVIAPRLKTSDIRNLALMIHHGGDNYSNNPPLGGGGDRIACGVVH